jgi:uncharacterized protein YvpB
MDLIATITSFEFTLIMLGYIFLISVMSLFFTIAAFTTVIAKHHKITIVIIGLCLYFMTIFFGFSTIKKLLKVPKVLNTLPHEYEVLNMKQPVINITFETPVNTQKIRINTFPETELAIMPETYFNNLIPFARKIKIIPKTTYPAGAPIMIYFSNIEGPLTQGYGGEYLLNLNAAELPTITQIIAPVNLDEVPISASFTANLSDPILASGKWNAILVPHVPLNVKSHNEKTLIIQPNEPLKQGTRYTLTVSQIPLIYRYSDQKILSELTPRLEKVIEFKTAAPPFIDQFAPNGKSIDPATPIQIAFDQPMNTTQIEQSLSISPATPLTFTWSNNGQILVISHPPLPKNTTYKVALPHGISTQKGGVLESDFNFEFTTLGPIVINSANPPDKAINVAIASAITLNFDQEMAPPFDTKMFTISPNVPGKINTDKSTLTFTPDKPLANSTKYTISLATGLPSKSGLPADKVQTISFTTAGEQVLLDVPFFMQQGLFTCNIASARMLLAYRGVNTDENTLISIIGEAGKRGAGNPNLGYVSDYGTYWDAVARGVAKYKPYHLIKDGKLSDITRELAKGNPVMTWGQNGWSDPHDISWTAQDGTFIKAVNGMHSSVIRGFSGPETNPTQIFLNDPWRGQYAIPTAEFLRRWSYYSVALVVE